MSSLFKLFGKKSKKSKEANKSAAKSEEYQLPPEIAAQVSSGKSKFTISHSGRYKAKRRDRVAVDHGFYESKSASKDSEQLKSELQAASRDSRAPKDSQSVKDSHSTRDAAAAKSKAAPWLKQPQAHATAL